MTENSNKKIWIALTSRSGDTLRKLVAHSKTAPDYHFSSKKYDVNTIYNFLLDQNKEDVIVTLIGFMRIIPKEVCDHLEGSLFNLHQADFELYPELKGKDPIDKSYILGIKDLSNVIHLATADLDSGEIVARCNYSVDSDIEITYNNSQVVAVDMWDKFLKDKIK